MILPNPLAGMVLCALFLEHVRRHCIDPLTKTCLPLSYLLVLDHDGTSHVIRKLLIAEEIALQELVYLRSYAFAVRMRVNPSTGATFTLRGDVPIRPL